MTLDGVISLILRYFTEFGSFWGPVRKSGWRCRKKFTFAISSPGEFSSLVQLCSIWPLQLARYLYAIAKYLVAVLRCNLMW